MTPNDWTLIEELFEAALSRSGADRAAWLAEGCGSWFEFLVITPPAPPT
jgi:hypothetical protein